jgi:WD40 repeat protein
MLIMCTVNVSGRKKNLQNCIKSACWQCSQIMRGIIIVYEMQFMLALLCTIRLVRRAAGIGLPSSLTVFVLLCAPLNLSALSPPGDAVGKNLTDKNPAVNPAPEIRLPLDALGYKPQLPAHLLNGESLRSLDFVDDNHLLLTYSLHDLLQRLPECGSDDDDQMIQAVLLELPSGRVMARRNWHMCDHARYLWPISHGRFLVRQGSQLGVIAPLENLKPAAADTDPLNPLLSDPLNPRAILKLDGAMLEIDFSPDGRMLTVQNSIPAPESSLAKLPGITTNGLGLTDAEDHSVSVNIYLLNSDAARVEEIVAQQLGDMKTAGVLWIAMIESGYLESIDAGTGKSWEMNFVSNDEEHTELANIESTCRPAPFFLSNREYATIVCPPGSDQKALAVYSLDVGLLWMQHFDLPFAQQTTALAPESNRFAFSVISTAYKTAHFEPLSADNTTGQWIRVFDIPTGSVLTTVDGNSIQTDGHNYTLAPDGRRLAVIGTDAIEVYALPATIPK